MTAFWEGDGADWVVPGALEVSVCEKKGKGRGAKKQIFCKSWTEVSLIEFY